MTSTNCIRLKLYAVFGLWASACTNIWTAYACDWRGYTSTMLLWVKPLPGYDNVIMTSP